MLIIIFQEIEMKTITMVETNDVEYFYNICGIEIDTPRDYKLRHGCRKIIKYIRDHKVLNND